MVQTGAKRALCLFLALLSALTLLFSSSLGNEAEARAFDKAIYANADPTLYQIEVDLTNKIITVFEKDSKGKYSKIARQFICTIGTDATPTPAGSFTLNDNRRRFGYFTKFDVYAQYWTQVAGGIFFHSILYTQPKEGYFTRSSFNALGKKSSHGCIRMLVEDARWIYYNCPAGTYGVLRDDKAKNDKLRQSLLPSISAKQYKPSADPYEAVKRENPKAKLKKQSTFTSSAGKNESIAKGSVVTVLSSGKKSCKVSVNGKTGYILTQHLDFIPNGVEDKQVKENSKEIYLVSSKQAKLYPIASKNAAATALFGKDTPVRLLEGSTKSFYHVQIAKQSGYMLKTDVSSKIVSNDYTGKIVELKLPSPSLKPSPSPDDIDRIESDVNDSDLPSSSPSPPLSPTASPSPTPEGPLYVDPRTGQTYRPGEGIYAGQE